MKRKVAFVSHCLLDQNAKVGEYALFRGVVQPIIDLLKEKGCEIQQLPCPELTYMGVNRWWQTKDQYDTPGYRRHSTFISSLSVELIRKYIDDGYQILIIGIDGSPSCGVRLTGRNPNWGGRPALLKGDHMTQEMGVFMEQLESELVRNNANTKLFGIPMDSPNFDMARTLDELSQFLNGD
jgi:predicted secreted protein